MSERDYPIYRCSDEEGSQLFHVRTQAQLHVGDVFRHEEHGPYEVVRRYHDMQQDVDVRYPSYDNVPVPGRYFVGKSPELIVRYVGP